MEKQHYEKLERMYLAANINTSFYQSTTIEIKEKTSKISILVAEKYFHALGAIHGSVYFKLLDDAAFFAVNSLVQDVFVLTTSFNLNIVKPASTGRITSVGKVKYQSRNLFVAESTIVDEKGIEIAFGTGNFTKSRVELSDKIGYK